MKNLFKNKIVTIIILIATLILAGIAIFTAMRLYQLRQESVAPTAPTSQPGAAAIGTCQMSFTIAATASSSPKSSPSSSPSVSPSPSACNLSVSPSTMTMGIGEKTTVTLTATGITGTINYTPVDSTVISVVKKTNTSFEVTALKAGTSKIRITISNEPTCLTEITVTVLPAGQSPTPTPSSAPTPTPSSAPTPTPSSASASGAAGSSAAQASSGTGAKGSSAPSLPDAGVSYPTILGAGLGILVILGAILLII